MTDDLLFAPGVTSIQVKCWDCGHTVVMTPDHVPAGLTDHEFEKRAVCRCGTGWPQITKYPKKMPTSI